MSYKVAYGYFEPDDVATKILSTPLDLNKNLPSGLLKFTNPQIIISAISNIGTYLIFQIDYVKALVSNNPTIEPVYAWFAGHTTKSTTEVLESKPAKPGFSVTKVMRTFDKDWGETNQLFKSVYKPDILEYKFSANVNKSLIKNDPTANFITPDAAIKVYMKTIIPFQFDFGSYFDYNFSISNEFKTLASELDKYPNESIDSAALVLNIVNGFPVNTQLKIKFIDTFGREITTDFVKEYLIKAGLVDSDGIVQPGHETKDTIIISLTKVQLASIRKAETITYSLKIDGETVNSNIHFIKSNTFDLKLGLFINGSISTTLGLKK